MTTKQGMIKIIIVPNLEHLIIRKSNMKCEVIDCDNEAMYYDIMSYEVCSECVEFEVAEFKGEKDDYELIN